MAIKTYTGGVKFLEKKPLKKEVSEQAFTSTTYAGGVKYLPDVKISELSSEVKGNENTLDKYDNILTTLDEQFKETPTQELANQYNSILGERNSLYKQYESKKTQLNSLIDEHNKSYTQAVSNWKQTFKEPQLEPKIPTEKPIYGFKKVEDTKLSAYQEPEKNIIDKMKAKIAGAFKEKPETQIAKAQVSYNISQATGVPITEIEKNLPVYTKELGVRGVPTSEEFLSAMFAFPVAAAIISNPVSAGIGVAKFMAMTEAENLIISKAKGWDYKFGAGKGLKELAPEDTNQITKDILDIVDFVVKGVVIRATDKNTKAMFDKFTKEVITKYSPSRKVYLSSEKIKDLHLNNPKLATQLEKDVYTNLEGKAEAARTAFKRGGIDVEIPAQTITKIADKPYWAKIKSLFNVKPYTKTVVENIAGKWSLHPAGLLPSPATELGAGITPKQMIGSLIKTGKLGVNIANQLKAMTPEQGVKFIQDLSVASPAIASKLMPELEKLIPTTVAVPEEPIPEGGEPPATVDKQNSIFNKAAKKIEDIATKAIQVVDIQAPFNKLNAKETGFQVKNYYSNIGWGHQRGLDAINKLNKVNVKPVTVEESGFKASGQLDYTDVTYLSERPGYFVKLDPEEKKIASGAKKLSKDFYKFWQDKVTEIGWMEEPFPQSFITRANNKIGGLKKQLKDIKKPEAKQLILNEIDKLTKQVERIKKQNIQFVSIPAKTILSNAETNPEIFQRIFSILPKWDRETITVKDLVDAKVITRKEADIRYIIGEYSDRMGKKYALGKIFETAEKEGLIKPQALVPNWLPARIYINGKYVDIPQLRGKRLEPFFSDTVTDFFSRGVVTLGPIMGTIKMMQFFNPLIMPMYDVWQAAAAGVFLNPIKGAEYIYNGIRDVLKHTDRYYLGFENGLFSKPYAIPYDTFERQFKEVMKGNKLISTLKRAALPTNWLPMLYQASWHTAWTLDPMIRMMSFNYLLNKGMSPRNAAQLAALYHSDYASVPPATRRTLNKIFFTPTFKITMGKLLGGMFKSIGKIMAKYPAKFLFGKDIKIYQKDKILARGALLALGIMMGIRQYFKSQGYKEENLFWKYSKMVETDEGMKENVITLSHPFNIPFRYYGRIRNAWAPSNLNVAAKLVETAKWDLHPIWRVAYDIVNNENFSIYNPFDEDEIVARDIALYAFTEFVAITKGILESAEAGEISAENFKILQKDMGKFQAIILRPFIYNYARDPRKIKAMRDIKKLRSEYQFMMLVDPSKDSAVNTKRMQNFVERVTAIQDSLKEREVAPKTERQKTYTGGVKLIEPEKEYTGGVKLLK